MRKLRDLTQVKLNLEMAATPEMDIACALRPEMAMLVPEGRHEVTTEGGLDVAAQEARLRGVGASRRCRHRGESAFIDAELAQVEAAARIGVRVCEIHTGPYAHAFHAAGRDARSPSVLAEIDKIAAAGSAIVGLGMRFNAGHALNFTTCSRSPACLRCASCTSAMRSSAARCSLGLRESVREMKRLMREAAASGA